MIATALHRPLFWLALLCSSLFLVTACGPTNGGASNANPAVQNVVPTTPNPVDPDQDKPDCVFDEDCADSEICNISVCSTGSRPTFLDESTDACSADADCDADCASGAACACTDGICQVAGDVSCTGAADCQNACPLAEIGCTCAAVGEHMLCRETCEEDANCSAGSCTDEGVCDPTLESTSVPGDDQ